MTRHTPAMIAELAPGEVFVFGSNAAGAHAGGAARFAFEKFGAIWGEGEGLQGRSYAINTMSGIEVLGAQVGRFLDFATSNPALTFLVTEIGCGIAGYKPEQIAGFFANAPSNVVLPTTFHEIATR